eukprot:CAMPEP_0202877950 /NCGR_PEP_ID=MMETSP1391-20130828/31385_1 /ASSEMBLY_ACC=CAM_ASM_000867 /TAXON_ID=1034604 /ORGANISM="Chlamydomonas leiostraca, Strain SAG 11-49" /LENGTH=103 /DNA_ID=CAMNT_0049560059 /DNA_START=139 /DNA_END=447 /DNA_ORIENTATION=-
MASPLCGPAGEDAGSSGVCSSPAAAAAALPPALVAACWPAPRLPNVMPRALASELPKLDAPGAAELRSRNSDAAAAADSTRLWNMGGWPLVRDRLALAALLGV